MHTVERSFAAAACSTTEATRGLCVRYNMVYSLLYECNEYNAL